MSRGFGEEDEGKELLRQAFAYAEKLQQQTKGLTKCTEVFVADIDAIRTKIHQKCEKVLFLSCSKRRKAEELLWRNVFYSVISHCKQHREVLDPTHPCYEEYSRHLISCSVYYQQLMQTLQQHYKMEVTKMDSRELEDLETSTHNTDGVWLKEACQRCYIYLGDIARYQIDLGYSPEHAVIYYQQAISLDPSNGWPFNQLAALSESQKNHLESLYYYLRSLTSTKPFPGIERNVERLFERNCTVMQGLELSIEKVLEPEVRSLKKQLLVAKFIRLQQLFYNGSRNKGVKPHQHSSSGSSSSEIASLCSEVVSLLEVCLEWDYQEHSRICNEKSKPVKQDKQASSSSVELLEFQLLLKMTTLSILPAYNLRLQGSADTMTASAFTLTVLSLLIHFAQKRMTESVRACLGGEEKETIEELLESEKTLMQLLAKTNGPAVYDKLSVMGLEQPLKTEQASLHPKSNKSVAQAKKLSREAKAEKRRKALKLMNKRRRQRRRGGAQSSSDEEETDSDSAGGDSSSEEEEKEGEGDGESILPPEHLGEDIDLQMIESLSDSSNDSPNEEDTTEKTPESKPSPNPPSGPKGRRHIVLAANFSLSVPSSSPVPKEQPSNIQQPPDKKATPTSLVEEDLKKLFISTDHQELVHKACLIGSKERYLCCVKVFSDWLQSYPAVLASYGKMSSTTLWSRLADLLNFLPNKSDLKESSISVDLDKSGSCSTWTQTCAIYEDTTLRGFAPLIRIHQNLLFRADPPPEIQQALMRIQCLIKFGHYVVNSKTTNVLSYNKSSERFMASAQMERENARDVKAASKLREEKAQLTRSKLMKAMAEQRLKSEVASLAKATAKMQASLFTPYLLPDAVTLCNSLHLVKKLIKSESFVFIIAKSVIESLDMMKKDRSNYAARDVIKFLERELQEGNKFIRAQKGEESTKPGERRPHKQDVDMWLFSCLVDCAIYFNCYSEGVSSDTPPTGPLLTMLLDKQLVKALEISDATPIRGPKPKQEIDPTMLKLLTEAKQSGVEIESVVKFYQRWQRSQKVTT